MPGPPVSLGANVVLTPGAAGPPDSGVILQVIQPTITANGQPLATAGSLCQLINSVTGVPYTLPIGPLASRAVMVDGRALVRVGDQIPSGPGVLLIAGPPATTSVLDQS